MTGKPLSPVASAVQNKPSRTLSVFENRRVVREWEGPPDLWTIIANTRCTVHGIKFTKTPPTFQAQPGCATHRPQQSRIPNATSSSTRSRSSKRRKRYMLTFPSRAKAIGPAKSRKTLSSCQDGSATKLYSRLPEYFAAAPSRRGKDGLSTRGGRRVPGFGTHYSCSPHCLSLMFIAFLTPTFMEA